MRFKIVIAIRVYKRNAIPKFKAYLGVFVAIFVGISTEGILRRKMM